jgi:DNA-binding SARP family transcriptional activator
MREADSLVEVRMIGALEVHRADGSSVQPGEWKTAKTRDLFRLLVLEQGRVVRTERILDALWPESDRSHGTASMRTAASRIRVVVGAHCVVREPGGLSLRGVRSDVDELSSLASRVRRLHSCEEHSAVLPAVAPHRQLLIGEFHADVLDSPTVGDDAWAVQTHERVAELQREVLTLQAESATAVGRLHEAVDLARRAVAGAPFWERPHRALMRALVGLGEADQALRVYERLQSTLEEDLGVDPSPETRALRDQLRGQLVPSSGGFAGTSTRPSGPADVRRIPSEPTTPAVLRIPAQPGWGGSFERYVLGWLRDAAQGATVRVQASLVGETGEVFALDVTSGVDGPEIIEAQPI